MEFTKYPEINSPDETPFFFTFHPPRASLDSCDNGVDSSTDSNRYLFFLFHGPLSCHDENVQKNRQLEIDLLIETEKNIHYEMTGVNLQILSFLLSIFRARKTKFILMFVFFTWNNDYRMNSPASLLRLGLGSSRFTLYICLAQQCEKLAERDWRTAGSGRFRCIDGSRVQRRRRDGRECLTRVGWRCV